MEHKKQLPSPSLLCNASPCVRGCLLVAQLHAPLLQATFTNGEEKLPDWVPGTDPCNGQPWTGITCTGSNVTEM